MAGDEGHDGASVQERLIEACRRDNTELLTEVLEGKGDAEISRLLNKTTTVMGNHLYHEAASRGNYDIIDLLLDQPDFECDPINRLEGDTPLHSAIRWLNSEPPAQRTFGAALVGMMLEAGSNPRVRNKARLTPLQLVDPSNEDLKELIRRHEYASQNAGDFVTQDASSSSSNNKNNGKQIPSGAPPPPPPPGSAPGRPMQQPAYDDESDDDAEFSGSDDEERAEWERRKRERRR